MSIVEIVNAVSLLIFIVLITLAFLRMAFRFRLYRAAGSTMPVLLKRDILLFFAFGTIVGLGFLFRLLGITGLGQNLMYVLFNDSIVDGALGYWVYVEYFIVDDPL